MHQFTCANCEDDYRPDSSTGHLRCEKNDDEHYCEWCADEHVARCAECTEREGLE